MVNFLWSLNCFCGCLFKWGEAHGLICSYDSSLPLWAPASQPLWDWVKPKMLEKGSKAKYTQTISSFQCCVYMDVLLYKTTALSGQQSRTEEETESRRGNNLPGTSPLVPTANISWAPQVFVLTVISYS